jgi:hypothetical protein
MAVALSFSIIFFLSFTLISFRHKLGGLSAILEKPLVQRLSAWIGFFGFLIGKQMLHQRGNSLTCFSGITSFLVVRMWFGKAMGDFNAIIEAQGQQRPRLVGSAGNGFTSAYEDLCTSVFC